MTPGISNLKILDGAHPNQQRPLSNTDISNEISDDKGPLKEVVVILFIIVPAGVTFLYLLVHALKECLRGCFY